MNDFCSKASPQFLNFERKQAIYSMINDMRTSRTYHQQGKKYDENSKKRNKNDKIPRDRD